MTATTHLNYRVVSGRTFPKGLRCAECKRRLAIGTPYSTRIRPGVSVKFVEQIVCVYCAVDHPVGEPLTRT